MKIQVSENLAKRIQTAKDLSNFYAYCERFENIDEYHFPKSEIERISELMEDLCYTNGKYDMAIVSRLLQSDNDYKLIME